MAAHEIPMVKEKNISVFNRDARANEGYLYSQTVRLSARLSNTRTSDAIQNLYDYRGKTVLDIGCGDGTFTLEFLERGAARVVGFDAAADAVERARRISAGRPEIEFEAVDVYHVQPRPERFDLAVLRGVLHHLYEPERAIRNLSALARSFVIVEP